MLVIEGDRWGDRFRALANPYRRQLLVALLEHTPQRDDTVDPPDHVTAPEADTERLRVNLVHVNLPKLAEMGFIDWDRETGNMSRGTNSPTGDSDQPGSLRQTSAARGPVENEYVIISGNSSVDSEDNHSDTSAL